MMIIDMIMMMINTVFGLFILPLFVCSLLNFLSWWLVVMVMMMLMILAMMVVVVVVVIILMIEISNDDLFVICPSAICYLPLCMYLPNSLTPIDMFQILAFFSPAMCFNGQ